MDMTNKTSAVLQDSGGGVAFETWVKNGKQSDKRSKNSEDEQKHSQNIFPRRTSCCYQDASPGGIDPFGDKAAEEQAALLRMQKFLADHAGEVLTNIVACLESGLFVCGRGLWRLQRLGWPIQQ